MSLSYDEIGTEYDVTRKADPVIVSKVAYLLGLNNLSSYLDVACGTGNYTVALSKLGGRWSAFDSSGQMISKAHSKSHIIEWSIQDVASMKYQDACFDGAICILAIHHFPDLQKALNEISRVLKRNSRFIIFTSTPPQMHGYWLCRYFPKMMEKSALQMPHKETVLEYLHAAGFDSIVTEPFFIADDLQDMFLYCGKHHPELYLSPYIRNGISSFHNFSDERELTGGLNTLSEDIKTGNINTIMKKYSNELGDYLFIGANK